MQPQTPGARLPILSIRTTLWPVVFALGILLATASGCAGGGPDEAMALYLDRLARTLSTEPGPITPPAVSALPPHREFNMDVSASKLDMLDFLSLSGCDVQVTIGKRNSSLGRLARPSQRLLLDLEYLQLAPACIALQRERGEAALADTLEQAWALKRQQLPALVFNATLGSSEYREFWKVQAYQADYPAGTGSEVITSLEAINNLTRRWLAGDFNADNREFEILLGQVATGDGGALVHALAAQAGGLAAANSMLQQRMDRGPLCKPGFRPAAADILANVIRKFFIGGIQPRAADLNRRYRDLLPPVLELEQLLDAALPAAYRAWRQHRDSEMVSLAAAPRGHVEQLLAIQEPCINRAEGAP